ncbi:hypothetical protein GKZ89_09615 [Bacillus mangrovi]|uniref:Toxic anion resistance protein n=1 Tax=Metabacillus mangrovi TaxID=1491830 RepID=A0A7X2S520_9BACI|nr:toxic anion resistance protein [Metabacillus mangrovi]MTH53660.1 hypothetical protein [Metabacillus mangrovi]
MNENEERKVEKMADSIFRKDLSEFGVPAQSGLLKISAQMMEYVKEKDRGQTGLVLKEIMDKLDEADPLKRSGFFSRFLPGKTPQELLSRYRKMSVQLDRAALRLAGSKDLLLADIEMLDDLYEQNEAFHRELNICIEAGERKLRELHPEEEAAESLDRRLYDLKISREIARQTAPQIKLIQHTNRLLIGKIQSSVLTAIPLWRNRISMASDVLRQQNAEDAPKALSDEKEALQRNLEESLLIQKEGFMQREDAERKLASLQIKKGV